MNTITRMRSFSVLIACAALYGFCIGASNSWLYAWRSAIKFPLLILTTAAVCSLCYDVLARFFGIRLGLVRVLRHVLGAFRDVCVLLASLTPPVFFLAQTTMRPGAGRLAEYPLFQGFNVVGIAICGGLAVVKLHRRLRREVCELDVHRRLIAAWLIVTLLVGAQVAWYMRPFFGIYGPATTDPPWFTGARPDFRGAGSFYEAVYLLLFG